MKEGLSRFFTEVASEMPDGPWSEEGVRHAEAAALRIFPDLDAADPETARPEDLPVIDAFQRFIGEVMMRRFEGRWLYAQHRVSLPPEPTIELPYYDVNVAPRATLNTLVSKRSGRHLAFIIKEQTREYELWVDHGRLRLRSGSPSGVGSHVSSFGGHDSARRFERSYFVRWRGAA